ncbi:MAG: glycosyltransferase family 9 protein [SAR324 cluster bacterium]|nr:glycosyltransferase family 9 protein [SAR324 cluster bacterium]
MNKILLIQLKQIGDCLMTTPAIRAIKLAYPESEIHFLTQTPSNQLFEHNPYVSKVHCFPKTSKLSDVIPAVMALRSEKYDLTIDFEVLPKTAVLSWLTGAKKRVGFNYRGRRLFYTHPFDAKPIGFYAAEKKLALLEAIGITATDSQIEFPIGPEEQQYAKDLFKELKVDPTRPIVTFSPVSRKAVKVWSLENFAWIADKLIAEKNIQVLLLWGPGEEHFIKDMRSYMDQEDLGDYEIPTIAETEAILLSVDLHVGNDNGLKHLAVAAHTPTVCIFGQARKANWTPPHGDHTALEFDPGCKWSCSFPDCELECLNVKKEDVWAELIKKVDGLKNAKSGS